MAAVWRWESDDGSKFNDFDPNTSSRLETALATGLPCFEISERNWLFDLGAMTQTNIRTLSKRSIKRVTIAVSPEFPVLGSVGHHFAPPSASALHATFGATSGPLPSPSRPLPYGWKQIGLADGRLYFHNADLNTTQWERPVDAPSSLLLPSGWVEQRVADGRPYYVNAVAGRISWQRPSNSPAAASFLPANWIEQTDVASGKLFYVNTVNGQSTWDRPDLLATSPLPDPHSDKAPPANWIHQIDPSTGRPFWVNVATGQSTWDPPPVPVPDIQPASSFHTLSTSHSSHFGHLNIAASAASPAPAPGPSAQKSSTLLPAPQSQVAWKWESDDGSKFNDFDPDTSSRLETALANGLPRFEISERNWLFDLGAMTQTNLRTLSKRRIQRLLTAPAIAAAIPQSNLDALQCVASAQSFSAAQPVRPLELPSAVHVPASGLLGASQIRVSSVDFGAVIQELVVAARSIPIDIVHGVFVRSGSDVQAAKEILVLINQLHDMMGSKCNFPEIATAMCACSDSFDQALEMLLREEPGEPTTVVGAVDAASTTPPPVPAISVPVVEKPLCLICMENPPSHAFIPCGHKQICGACSEQKAIVDGLHGKCPTCRAAFEKLLHIYED